MWHNANYNLYESEHLRLKYNYKFLSSYEVNTAIWFKWAKKLGFCSRKYNKHLIWNLEISEIISCYVLLAVSPFSWAICAMSCGAR